MMGSRVRSSTATMAPISTAPATIVVTTAGEPHPRSGPSDTPYMRQPKPLPESANPGRSNRPGFSWGWCWRNTAPKAMAATPIGTLT